MPKGCCGGGECSCKIVGPTNGRLTVSGSGQPGDPFILDVDVNVQGGHNNSFDVGITGDGSEADPWIISTNYATTAKLDDIPDVNTPGPTNGQVLSWNSSTNKWVAASPTVAPTGAVSHDTSLAGDGSPATPLGVAPVTARLLATFTQGLGLSDLGMASVTQHFTDAAARTAAIPLPRINSLTMLDVNPGIVEYWTGSAWSRLPNQTTWTVGDEFLPLSGDYVAGSPVGVSVIQLNVTTDANGVFDVLTPTDLAGRSGVLTLTVQETGAIGWKAMPYPNTNKVSATAYRLTDGSVMAGQPLTATVQAITY